MSTGLLKSWLVSFDFPQTSSYLYDKSSFTLTIQHFDLNLLRLHSICTKHWDDHFPLYYYLQFLWFFLCVICKCTINNADCLTSTLISSNELFVHWYQDISFLVQEIGRWFRSACFHAIQRISYCNVWVAVYGLQTKLHRSLPFLQRTHIWETIFFNFFFSSHFSQLVQFGLGFLTRKDGIQHIGTRARYQVLLYFIFT